MALPSGSMLRSLPFRKIQNLELFYIWIHWAIFMLLFFFLNSKRVWVLAVQYSAFHSNWTSRFKIKIKMKKQTQFLFNIKELFACTAHTKWNACIMYQLIWLNKKFNQNYAHRDQHYTKEREQQHEPHANGNELPKTCKKKRNWEFLRNGTITTK